MSLRKVLFVVWSLVIVGLVVVAGFMTSPEVQAACLSSTVTAGESARASQYNNLRQDFYTGKFFDSACAGSNYLQVLHNGTDGVIQTNTGKIRISPPSGSTIDLEVNGTDVLVIGSAGITASQYIAGASNLGLTGSLEVDGTSKLDGILNVAGATTLSSTLTASGAIGTTSTAHVGGASHFVGAITAASTARVNGVVTADSGVKLKASGTGSDTLDSYEQGGTFTPTVAYSTPGTSSWTFTNQSGIYRKIGRVVFLTATVTWSSNTIGTGSGEFRLTGLPYSAANVTGGDSFCQIYVSGINFPTGGTEHVAVVFQNASYANFYSMATGTSTLRWDTTTAGFSVAAGAGQARISCTILTGS